MRIIFGLIFGASIVLGQARAIDDATLKAAGKAGGDWLTYGLTQGETRYSPLNQINTTNVNRLGLAWSYDLGKGGGTQEDTPLVSNGVMYGITNWSIVFALDARTGKERWRWDPEINQDTVFPKLCCGVVNRGVALYQNLVIAPLNDGRLVALDSSTGKVVWEARVGFTQDQYTLTMAPRIAKGKVIIGASGGDRPTRGFFSAFDALTGRLAWKFYTIPGDPSKPFENAAMKKASETWEGDFWKLGGGGAVWDMEPGRSAALKLLGGQTAESVMLFEETAPPGTATDFHLHHDSDEVAYVLSGEITFLIGDKVTVGRAGSCAFMPRTVPHAWKSTGAETGRVLLRRHR